MLSNIPKFYWAMAIIAAVVAFYVYSTLQRNADANRPATSFREFFFGHGRHVFKDEHDEVIPFSRFAGAEVLRNARSQELIAEIETLIAQHGLPADVFRGLSGDLPDEEWQRLRFNNIALTLNNFFGEFYEAESDDSRVPRNNDMTTLWDASPIVDWEVDAQTLDRVRETLARLEPRRQSLRNELRSPHTLFHYIFISPEMIEREVVFRGRTVTTTATSSSGTTISTGASKYLADYALLEEYAIAQALLDGEIGEALTALANIFRIAYLASMLEDVGVRADAAHVRLRAFDVMQRVVLDPAFERQDMIFLRNMLEEEYQNWTPEYVAWFGDRASGLMMYQRIAVEFTLEPADIQQLSERGITMLDVSQSFLQYREEDMVFYLQMMQRILDISGEPFVRRLEVLDQINWEFSAKQGMYNHDGIALKPFIAWLRFQHVERMMALFAQDQSALNRALVAILRSLGQPNTDSYRDPFTGEPYEVIIDDDGLISVSATMLPRPFRVPDFTERELPDSE
jgi:hypothetical protein